jgi:hypothetical protein
MQLRERTEKILLRIDSSSIFAISTIATSPSRNSKTPPRLPAGTPDGLCQLDEVKSCDLTDRRHGFHAARGPRTNFGALSITRLPARVGLALAPEALEIRVAGAERRAYLLDYFRPETSW